jgi:hypothetical protein
MSEFTLSTASDVVKFLMMTPAIIDDCLNDLIHF